MQGRTTIECFGYVFLNCLLFQDIDLRIGRTRQSYDCSWTDHNWRAESLLSDGDSVRVMTSGSFGADGRYFLIGLALRVTLTASVQDGHLLPRVANTRPIGLTSTW